jgi:hypothetical protein
MRARLVALSLLGSIAFAVSARAGNDDEMLLGNRASMTGGAVSATVSDASSTWYNPAGLGVDRRSKIDVSATAYSLRRYTVPQFLSTTTGASIDGSVTEFVSVPTQIAFVRRIAPAWSLGLGYFVPHISNFVLREGLGENDTTGASQWQVSASVADTQHTAAAAIGGTIAPGIRVGVSLIGGYAAIIQSVALFAAVKRGGQAESVSSRAYIGTSTQLSLQSGVGLQWDVTSALTLGMSCRTPRVQVYRTANVNLNDSYATVGGTSPGAFGNAQRVVEETGLGLLSAGRFGLALAHRLGGGWVAGELDVQPGLLRPDTGVDRKAILNARLGIYQPIAQSVALGAGIFTDRNPIALRYGLLSGNGDFYGATVGIEINNEHRLAPTEPSDSLVFSTVFALRYAFSNGGFGRPVGDPDAITADAGPFREAEGVLRVHELAFYVGSGLHF